MPSPFPGMDPYLEASWPDVHSTLVPLIRKAVQHQLPPGLRAVIEREVRLEAEPEDEGDRYRPDAHIREEDEIAPSTVKYPTSTASGISLAEPFTLRLASASFRRKWVQIIDAETRNRVITVIEVLSPSNKLSGEDNRKYRQKLRDYADADVSVVEIDLLRGSGRGRLEFDQSDLPPERRAPYLIGVRRPWASNDWLIYSQPLRARLAPFPVPLRRDDAPVVLDLQPLIDEVYAEGQYDRYVDYSKPPDPPLSPEDAEWARALLAGHRS